MSSQTEEQTIESFNKIRSQFKSVDDKYQALSERLVAEMKADGINIRQEDLQKLSSFRAAVLAEDDFFLGGDKWKQEATKLIPAAREADEMKKLHAALASEDSEESDAAIEEFANLSGAERIAKFRAMNAAAAPSSPSPVVAAAPVLSPQEKARKIRELERLPPSLRMAAARKAGLV